MNSLPRHKLLRLAALDNVRAFVDSLKRLANQEAGPELKAHALKLAGELTLHAGKASRLTLGGDGLELGRKEYNRYLRQIRTMQATITASWGAEMGAAEYLAAILEMVVTVEDQLPRTPAYMDDRYEWGKLERILGDIYALFDPAYKNHRGMDYGEAIGRKLMRVEGI